MNNKNEDEKLVFIYNADSGLINAVKDYFHKRRSPETYQCNLCMQTFGAISMKKDWKSYVKNLDISAEFLHKDEFEKTYDVKGAKYPSAYYKNGSNMKLVISQEEMDAVNSLEELKDLVSKKLNTTS
jgi:hypothetical protein